MVNLSKTKHTVLTMPDNELDELADNFFCHINDNCHGHSDHKHEEGDQTNALNPLRNPNTLRKSILLNNSVFILNENHLNFESIKLENDNKIRCSKCSFNIGYRGKCFKSQFFFIHYSKLFSLDRRSINDYYLWRGNVLVNDNDLPFDLFSVLQQGRYLIDTCKHQNTSNYLYLWILNDTAYFKLLELADFKSKSHIEASLNLNQLLSSSNLKKLMFKYKDYDEKDTNSYSNFEVKDLNNDFHIDSITVSLETYKQMLSLLKNSNSKLCDSIKNSADFLFAII